MPATVWAVIPAAATIERFGRLLLLVATVIGVAALHTVGHASLTSLDHHDRAVVVVDLSAVTIAAAPAPADDGGCDGDGCTHPVPGPAAAADQSAWWDACVAVLTVLTGGPSPAVLRIAPQVTLRHARRRTPHAPIPPLGLALATTAVRRT